MKSSFPRYLMLLTTLLISQVALGQLDMKKTGNAAPARFQPVPVDTTIHPMLSRGHYTFATVIDGDTIPLYYMKEVKVYSDGMLLTQKEIQQNKKLIRNVKLMRPYALEGKRRLDELEVQIAALPRKDRKKAIKEAEAQLLHDYKGELSNYTFSQGLVIRRSQSALT